MVENIRIVLILCNGLFERLGSLRWVVQFHVDTRKLDP